jgi:hypothetical protein
MTSISFDIDVISAAADDVKLLFKGGAAVLATIKLMIQRRTTGPAELKKHSQPVDPTLRLQTPSAARGQTPRPPAPMP